MDRLQLVGQLSSPPPPPSLKGSVQQGIPGGVSRDKEKKKVPSRREFAREERERERVRFAIARAIHKRVSREGTGGGGERPRIAQLRLAAVAE